MAWFESKQNRKRLIDADPYSLLTVMQENLEKTNVSEETPCIMNVLGEHGVLKRCGEYNGKCGACIAAWLNERTTKRKFEL